MKRFKKTDFPNLSPIVKLLVEMQQARHDKKFGGSGLSIQEEAELLGIFHFLKKEESEQSDFSPKVQQFVDKWYSLKDNMKLNDDDVIEQFDNYVIDLMKTYKLK